MRFTKMHGAGNDYVYVNCFEEPYPPDAAGLAQKCPTGITALAATA